MPSIELLKTQQISDRVPGANIANADATSKALVEAGGELANMAYRMFDQQKRVESETFITDSKLKYNEELSNKTEETRVKYEKAAKESNTPVDYEGYKKEVATLGEDLKNQYASNAPYESAKSAFLNETAAISSRNNSITHEYVQKQKLEAARQSKDQEIVSLGQQVYKNPNDPTLDVDYAKALDNANDPDLFTPDEVAKRQDVVRQSYRNSKLEGFLSQGNNLESNGKMQKSLDSYKKGLDFLKSGHDSLKDMSPDDLLKAETRLENGLKTARTNAGNHTKAKVSAFLNSEITDPTLTQNLLNEIRSNPSTDSFTKEYLSSQVLTKSAVDKVSAGIGLVPPKDRDLDGYIQKTLDGMAIKDPYISGNVKATLKEQVKLRVNADTEQMKKDPATYFATRDSSLSNLSASIVAGDAEAFQKMKTRLDGYYDQWGVGKSNRRYLPAPIANHFKESFVTATKTGDYRIALDVVSTLDRVGGEKDTTKLLFESGIDSKYAVIGDVAPNLRATFMQDLINKDKNFKNRDTLGIKKEDLDSFKNDLFNSDEMKAITSTSGGRGAEYRDSLVNLYEAHYLGQVSRGGASLGSKEAKDLLNSKYTFASSGKSKVYAPKNVEQDRLENFLEDNTGSGVDYVSNFSVYVDGAKGESAGAKNEDLQDTARWVTGRNGLELWKTTNYGKLVPVFSGKSEAELKHITLDWSDVNSGKINSAKKTSDEALKRDRIKHMFKGNK